MTPARDREAMDQAIVRGSDQLKQGKLDQAQRSFREALEIDPANTKVLALLGLTYFRGNQFAEARPIYEQLVERAPTDASHRLNLGLVYLKLGDGERAIAALEASRALDPSQGRATSYLGLAYARAGRYAEAYRAFLMAGQNELAREIELNLTTTEREQIQAQLGRAPAAAPAPEPPPEPPATARTSTPTTTPVPRTSPPLRPPGAPAATIAPASESSEPRRTAHTIARTDSKPNRTSSNDLTAKAEAARSLRPTVPVPMSESQQFVLPARDPAAPQAPHAAQSMVSMAVAAATPATPAPLRAVTTSGTPPRPLSELATEDLVRPEEAETTFEIAAGGALVMRVSDRVMTRLEGVHVTGGDLAYEPATRRSRGHQTDERFEYGASPLYAVSGSGYLVAVPGDHTFIAVALDDDILYLREDLVFAFESSLRWENGNVPGLRGKLPIVQFRGDGALVLRTPRPLVRVKLPSSGVLLVDAARIAGWIGRVIPRAVVPAVDGPLGTMCVECTGEGVVLVEPAPKDELRSATVREARASTPPTLASKPPPPPPAAPVAEAPEVADVAALASPAGLGGPDDGASLDTESAIDRLDEL